jgi:hypothetical protein
VVVLKIFRVKSNSGFSSLHFFSSLRDAVPEPQKPRILRIRYGSPGSIDLNQIADVAVIIGVLVKVYKAWKDRGGPPSPPSGPSATNISVRDSSHVIINVITGNSNTSQFATLIPDRHTREAIFRWIGYRVDRLSQFLFDEKITDLALPSDND